jgi:hypothetical protein
LAIVAVSVWLHILLVKEGFLNFCLLLVVQVVALACIPHSSAVKKGYGPSLIQSFLLMKLWAKR